MSDFTSTRQYRKCQEIFTRWYPGFRNAGEQYQDIIADLVTPESLLLDLGCGRMSLAAEQIQRVKRSVGVDLGFADLQHNKTVSHPVLADAKALPFPDNSFDLIISQWAVEHFERPEAVFAQIARILRPGGHCVLFTTNANNYIPLLSRMLSGRSRGGLITRLLRRPQHESFPTYYRANTARRIAELGKQVGLYTADTIYAGNPFYLAFSPALFYLGLAFEKITDVQSLYHFKIYLLSVISKPTEGGCSNPTGRLSGK